MALSKHLLEIGLDSTEAQFLGDSQELNLTAAGNSQATATPIVATINQVTGGTTITDDGLRLPPVSSFKGSYIAIRSVYIGFAVDVFPAVDERIDGQLDNVPVSLAAGSALILFKVGDGAWISFKGA